jgi:methionyl aminopeptidase
MNTLDEILNALSGFVLVGSTGNKLEASAKFLLANYGVEPVFPEQKREGSDEPYGYILCVSVNNEVIHGMPNDRPFEEGDVVSIDCGIKDKDGLIYDGATTVLVGERDKDNPEIVYGCSASARKVVKATKEALEAGVLAAKAGKTNFTITEAIEKIAKKYDLAVVQGYGGHGVGEKLHEEPFIANRAADVKGEPFKLEAGKRIAIEPMFSTSRGETYVEKNGWTVKVPAGVTAHFERTIVVS